MYADIEETLGRELHEVADELPIPVMPALPAAEPSRPRRWQPVLIGAAAVVLLAGAVAFVVSDASEGDHSPAPEPTLTETPVPPEPEATLPRTPPMVPYVFENKLYVGGALVEGNWCCVYGAPVDGAGNAWLGWDEDGWWWGNGRQVERLTDLVDVPPVISPDARTVAMLRREGGRVVVTGFETRFGGEGLVGFPIDPGNPALGDPVRVRAVTNERQVVVQGQGQSWLWLPDAGEGTVVDLNETAPGQQVHGATPAGLIVSDESESEFYLASISDAGALTRIANLPPHDDLAVTPDGQWAMFVPQGTLGGELAAIPTLSAFNVNGDDVIVTLTAPEGWNFRVHTWAWEDNDHLIVAVMSDPGERMARCSVRLARCTLIDAG
ncbi:MAG TPA: hypothetical protein VFK41_00475 [Nocardioidaceae bacterium]|nr:hypothetical protein [Nocardioidaceae bacterium]